MLAWPAMPGTAQPDPRRTNGLTFDNDTMDIYYGQPGNFHWLWLVLLVAIVTFVSIVLHRRAVAQFATPNLLGQLIGSLGLWRDVVSSALIVGALALTVVGLVDIRWGKIWRDVPQKGIEVIFALDVSRSMLAEDISPNRLSRAKQNIKDMVREMAGDRVGLIVFAGDVRPHIPLTNHYADFEQSLEEVGPHNIERGGSNLGEAITLATESFLEKTADHKAIVLITDGEDHQSNPVEAAKQAYEEQGVRIFTVGLGDFEKGARIPTQTGSRQVGFVHHEGEQVWSKLNGDLLKEVAIASEGAYIPAGTKQVDMAAVYHRFIGSIEQQEFDTAKINTYVPRYPWFLGAALGLVAGSQMISAFEKRNRSQAFRPFQPVDESGG